MILVKLAGGMGNQMFQYAIGRCLAERHKTSLKLDLAFLLDRTPRDNFVYRNYDLGIFNIREEFASPSETVDFGKHYRIGRVLYSIKRLLDPTRLLYVRENPYGFDDRFSSFLDNVYLEGYWQSEKYFKDIEGAIRQEFTFKNPMTIEAQKLQAEISSCNSVCVNVRRADYVTNPVANKHHGVCGLDYFSQAFSLVKSRIRNPKVYIFSDDIEWCRMYMKFDCPYFVVGHEYAGEKFGQYLNLMSACRNFIIPNSSFGWWGAWLSNNPEKIVVAPKRWCQDSKYDKSSIYPVGWNIL